MSRLNTWHHLVETLSREEGDVPGWVMVTLMTAGLVVALSAIALPALTKLFNDALATIAVV